MRSAPLISYTAVQSADILSTLSSLSDSTLLLRILLLCPVLSYFSLYLSLPLSPSTLPLPLPLPFYPSPSPPSPPLPFYAPPPLSLVGVYVRVSITLCFLPPLHSSVTPSLSAPLFRLSYAHDDTPFNPLHAYGYSAHPGTIDRDGSCAAIPCFSPLFAS